MSRIGLLVEGGIDEALLPALLTSATVWLTQGRRNPITTCTFPFPSGGFGEIPKNLRTLALLYSDRSERERLSCELFIVVHDSRKTEETQREIRTILNDNPTFPAVYGLAVQEIEAWVLGDIDRVNREVFRIDPAPKLQKSPEKDADPKATLTELFVRPSKAVEFDRWNIECARMVAPHLRAEQVAIRCPKGFGKLAKKLRQVLPR